MREDEGFFSFYAIIYQKELLNGNSVKIPEKIPEHIKKPYDKFINETLVVELYREGLFTLRQAAEILGVGLNEMIDPNPDIEIPQTYF